MGELLIMRKKELRRKSILDMVLGGQLSLEDASKRLKLSYRQIRRIYKRYRELGEEGLIHKSRGKASPRAIIPEVKEAVIALY